MKLSMNTRLNIFRIIFLALGFLMCISKVNATHIVGGDITYKYLGKDTFEITLTVRRDCELGAPDAQFDDPAHITFYDGLTRRVRIDIGDLGLVRVPYSDDDTLNTFIRSECGFEGAQVCVHETKYKTKVRLPYTNRGFYVVYERCCRNSSLNNIVDPLDAGSTYQVRIDRVLESQTNSSPVFKQWPDVYICKDKAIDFDHSATDIDGDSLVYKLWNSYYGRTQESPTLMQPYSRLPEFVPVQFLEGFGADNFFGGEPLKINAKTGVLSGTPNSVGQYLVGVEVQEYRDGKYLGSIYRDFQYNVRICAQPPVADFIVPTDCKSLAVQFQNNSQSSGRFEWNFNYPNSDSTFFSTEINPLFTFPTPGIYQVQLTAIRGSDQCRNTIIKQVPVFDIDYLANFDVVTADCGEGDSISVSLIDRSVISDNQFTTESIVWTVTQNDIVRTFSGPNITFKVSLTGDIQVLQKIVANNLCSASLSKTISINDLLVMADFELSNVSCDDDETVTIALEDKSLFKGSNALVESVVWTVTTDDGNVFTSNERLFMVKLPRTGVTVQLVATAAGCSDTITKIIPVSELFPQIDFKTTLEECRDSSILIKFVPSISNMSQTVDIVRLEWEINGVISNEDSIIYEIKHNEIVVISLKAILSNGCEVRVERAFSGNGFRPIANISVNPVECPDTDSVTYRGVYTGNFGYLSVNWSVGTSSNQITSSGPQVLFTIHKDSAYIATATGIYGKGCDATATKTGDGGQFATIRFLADPLQLCVGETSKIVANPNPNFTYTWSPTTGLDLSNPSDPIVTGLANITYSVTVSDGLCSVMDQVSVVVSDSLRLQITGDKTSCDGSYKLFATGGNGKGTYMWSLDENFTAIIAQGDSIEFNSLDRTTTIYVTIISDFCKVRPASAVLSLVTPFVVEDDINQYCAGDSFLYTLTSGDGADYTIVWRANDHIISSLSAKSIQVATQIGETGNIVLYYTATNNFGCTVSDSVVLTPGIRPVIDFTYSRANCENTQTCFTISGDAVTSVLWDFGMDGDQDTSTSFSPCFVYPSFGSYVVTLSSNIEVCGFSEVVKTIIINNELDIIAQDDVVVCLNDTAVLRVISNLPEMNLQWFDSLGQLLATGPVFSFVPEKDTKLFVKGTDAGGCEYLDSLIVRINTDFPELNGDGTFTVCQGDSAILAVFKGDLTTYQISWFANPIIIGDINVGNPVIKIPSDHIGDIFLGYTIVNEDGCTRQGEIKLTVNPAGNYALVFTKPECEGNEVCFNITGGFSGQVTWDFGDGSIVSDNDSICYTYANPGVYTVRAKGNAAFCNFNELTAIVIVGGQADLFVGDDVVFCAGDTVMLTVNPNLGDLEIVWQDEAGNILSNGEVYQFIPTADTKIIIKATDLAQCVYFDTVNVKINTDFPMLAFDGPFTVCLGDTAVLPAFTGDVSAYEIIWAASPYIIGDLNVANPVIGFGPNSEPEVTLNFTINNGDSCSQIGSVVINVKTTDKIDLNFIKPDCEGNEVCFNIIGGSSGQVTWDFGDGSIVSDNDSICYTYANPGVYTVRAKGNAAFCNFNELTAIVIVGGQADLFVGDDVVFCAGDTVMLTVNPNLGDLEIVWQDEAGNILSNGEVYQFIPTADTKIIIKATDLAQCVYFDTVNVKINTDFPMLAFDGPFTVCLGDTAVLPAFTGDVSAYEIIWAASPYIIGDLNVANPLLGIGATTDTEVTLNFTINNGDDCSQIGSVVINVKSAANIDLAFTKPDCEGNEVCFKINGGSSGQVTWDFGDGNIVSDNDSICYTYANPGVYTVRAKGNAAFCNFNELTAIVIVGGQADLFVGDDVVFCAGDTVMLTVNPNLGDLEIVWQDEAGNILSNGEVYQFIPTADTKIIIKATDLAQCVYFDTINVKINTDFPMLAFDGPFTVCVGDTGVLPAFIGDVSAYEIIWDASPYIVGNLSVANPVIGVGTTIDTEVTLSFTINNAAGCSQKGTAKISVKPSTNIDLTFTKPNCEGNEVCFQITGDYAGQISWDFGNGVSLIGETTQCYTYPTTGVYTVMAQGNGAFCGFDSISKTVIVGGIADLFGDDEVLLCADDTTTITVKSNLRDLDISWLDEAGNVLFNGPVYTFIPSMNTKLILKATDQAQCSFFDTVSIKVNNIFPMLSVEGPFIVCEGDTATLPAFNQDVSGFDITWSQNQYIIGTLNIANPLVGFGGAMEGDVTLNFTVVNAQGCIQLGQAPLVIKTKPTGDFSIRVDNCEENTVCFTTTIDERVGIKWDFGNNNATNDTSLNSTVCYSYPGAGNYNVTLKTTGDFCTLPLIEKPIALYDLGEILAQNIFNVCLRDTFQTVVLDEVPADFTIQWFDGANLVAEGRELMFQVLGSRMIRVIATDPNGCSYLDSVMLIGINEFPQLEYLNELPACLGDTVRITMVNANPNHIVTILWDENEHFVGPRDILNPMVGIEADEMEPFYVYFTAFTQFGCSIRDSIYFAPSSPNVVSLSHFARDCENYEVCYTVEGDFNGLVIWNFGDPNKPSGNVIGRQACFTYSGPGTYTVSVTNFSAFCAFETTMKTITLRDELIIFEEPSITICKGETRQLSAPASVGSFKYEWYDLNGKTLGVNKPVNVFGDQNKSIRIMVTDDNGCFFEDTLSINVFAPDYVINMPAVFCEDVTAQLEIVFTGSTPDNYNFVWVPTSSILSGANTHNPIIDVTRATSVFVTFEHKTFGCSVKDTVVVVPFTFNISVQASPDTIVDLLEEVTLSVVNPQNGWTYLWSNGAKTASQTVVAEENTTYTVTVTDANGCTAVGQVSIRVNPPDCEEDVFLPTAFSPNRDGNNEILYVRSNYIDEMELLIFNRWGQEVFSSTNINNGWDGTFKGKELTPDAFGYYLRATCIDGTTITRKGNISLLR